MQQIDRVTAMARQAAQLLPEPPDDRDIDGYLAWTELVWTTAMRLSTIAGASLDEESARHLVVDLEGPVTAQHLMNLARIARLEWQQAPAALVSSHRSTGTAEGPLLAPPTAVTRKSPSSAIGATLSTSRRLLGTRTRQCGCAAGGSPSRHH